MLWPWWWNNCAIQDNCQQANFVTAFRSVNRKLHKKSGVSDIICWLLFLHEPFGKIYTSQFSFVKEVHRTVLSNKHAFQGWNESSDYTSALLYHAPCYTTRPEFGTPLLPGSFFIKSLLLARLYCSPQKLGIWLCRLGTRVLRLETRQNSNLKLHMQLVSEVFIALPLAVFRLVVAFEVPHRRKKQWRISWHCCTCYCSTVQWLHIVSATRQPQQSHIP